MKETVIKYMTITEDGSKHNLNTSNVPIGDMPRLASEMVGMILDLSKRMVEDGHWDEDQREEFRQHFEDSLLGRVSD